MKSTPSALANVKYLGQSGVRLQFPDCAVYVDPYLTDSVAAQFGEPLRRLVPAPVAPGDVTDAQWTLITHAHLDHCDPETLLPISIASPQCRFMGPPPVISTLRKLGFAEHRLVPASSRVIALSESVSVYSVPAAHPEIIRDESGQYECVGYVLEHRGCRIWHAGDTSASHEIEAVLKQLGRITAAFLPVNERNYYREKAGIIGNMSLREAFQLAENVGVDTVIPIHWELFGPNSVFADEIELFVTLSRPSFAVRLRPSTIAG